MPEEGGRVRHFPQAELLLSDLLRNVVPRCQFSTSAYQV